MMEKNSEVKLNRDARRNINFKILLYLILATVVVSIFFCQEHAKTCMTYSLIGSVLGFANGFKQTRLEQCFDIIMTLDTILAAAVIFYYSVQDNRKEGIPHRTIMAYTVGSFTIPVLLISIMVMMAINFWLISMHYVISAWVGLGFTFITQIIIIVWILLSTSCQYSIYAIRNAEIKQFQRLAEKLDKGVNNTPSYMWTHFLHHLEQVVLSDELIADKLILIRSLLRTPYYQKKLSFSKWVVEMIIKDFGIKRNLNKEINIQSLALNPLTSVYIFYYENLVAFFGHINKKEDMEERNKIYLVLYEFMRELKNTYVKAVNQDNIVDTTANNYRDTYLMVMSGIINAILNSNLDDGEYVCNYIFNEIVDRGVWEVQISLYFLFHEYLWQTNSEAVKLNNLIQIVGLEEWNGLSEYREVYERFWDIWMEFDTSSPKGNFRYFIAAYRTLNGEKYESGIMLYIRLVIQEIKRLYGYESKSN